MSTTVGKFQGFQTRAVQQQEKKPAKRVQDWIKGEELVGFWMEDKIFPGSEYGPCTYHYFIVAEIKKDQIYTNDEVVVLRSGAGLANQLKDLKKGQLVKITFHGKEKNAKTGRSFHKFVCERADNIYEPSSKVEYTPAPSKPNLSVASKEEEQFEIDWED